MARTAGTGAAARENQRRRARAADLDGDPETGETGDDPAARDEGSATKMISARVRAGNRVTLPDTNAAGDSVDRVYGPGSLVSVSERDIKSRPWAFEVGERRARSGQTIRLQKKIEELNAEIERLKAEKKTAGKPDPNRAAAVESIMARGDNFIGRGEPQIGAIPRADAEAHERGEDLSLPTGREDDDALSLDEETGMHGIGREGAAGPSDTGAGISGTTGAGASIPSAPKPGESVRPGTGEPSSEKPQ